VRRVLAQHNPDEKALGAVHDLVLAGLRQQSDGRAQPVGMDAHLAAAAGGHVDAEQIAERPCARMNDDTPATVAGGGGRVTCSLRRRAAVFPRSYRRGSVGDVQAIGQATVRPRLGRPFRAFADPGTYKALLFFLTAVPFGALGVTVILAGMLVTGLLAITPLVVPVLIGFGALVRLLARAEDGLASGLLGAGIPPRPRPAARGFWSRGSAVLSDGGFWKAQAYLLLRFLVGWPTTIVQLVVFGYALAFVTAPIYYRWLPADEGANGFDLEIWKADTLAKAFLLVPLGLVLLVVAVNLVRPVAALWRRVATRLLGGTIPGVADRAVTDAQRRRALAAHAIAALGVSAVVVLIWGLTTRGYFWPMWVMLPAGLLLAVHGWITLVQLEPEMWLRRRLGRGFAFQLGISAALGVFLVLVWAVTTRGYFWPAWVFLGLGVLLLAHLVYVLATRSRRAELERRIDVLTESRAGAVDAQEAKLRRIERDLHDGAQARLVSLGMSLGMAEQKLATDPDGARQLLVDARMGAHEALEDLRDLARGIHPPLLSDRGLEAAVGALAARSPIRVSMSVEADRPPAAVETAAYFVAAEALANASKHADPTRVDIRIVKERDALVVEVVDDGPGGADPAGAGLTGMRRRVEALDGTLHVSSPAGGPTVVRAELPCAS
jgi:signal transduction histidine kinase